MDFCFQCVELHQLGKNNKTAKQLKALSGSHRGGTWSQYRRSIVEWRHVGAICSSSILYRKSTSGKRWQRRWLGPTPNRRPYTSRLYNVGRLRLVRRTTPANEVFARCWGRIRAPCCVMHVACVPSRRISSKLFTASTSCYRWWSREGKGRKV